MLFQAWADYLLRLLVIFQSQPHLQRHHLTFYLRAPNIFLTFPLCVLWLIIYSYVLTLHLLSVSDFIHKQCHLFLYDHFIYSLLLICIILLFHLVNIKIYLCILYDLNFYKSMILCQINFNN